MRTRNAVLGLMCAVALSVPAAVCGTVYWTPAHELAPQGMNCAMTAGDFDGDGDYDLTLFCEPMKQWWNVGSPTVPAWEFGPSPYVGVPVCVAQMGDLADLDSDGDLDLAITCWYDDFVRCYWNTGTPGDPVWQEDLSVFDDVLMYGAHYCPRLVDMDADGDLDMMLANPSGSIRYSRNVGTAQVPSYEHVDWVAGVPSVSGGNPTMAFGDLDSDGDLDIVRVSQSTPPECFENVGTALAFEYEENPQMLDGVSLSPFDGAWGVELLDIDADGDPDLMLAVGYIGENLLFLNEDVTPVAPTSWGVIKAMYR